MHPVSETIRCCRLATFEHVLQRQQEHVSKAALKVNKD